MSDVTRDPDASIVEPPAGEPGPRPIADRDPGEVAEIAARLRAAYEELVGAGISLDLTRGKPSSAQLDLSDALLALPGEGGYRDAAGADLRNYGGSPQGLGELREIFSGPLGIPVDRLVAYNNSSLELMHAVLTRALLAGVPGGEPWAGRDVAVLCPVPGYDRHFALTESLGIRMIPIPMTPDGPDVAEAERIAAADDRVVGMWCVPQYSNPTGVVYSDDVVDGLASMRTASADFRLLWDHAYAVHHLTEHPRRLADVLERAAAAGHPDRPVVFASTSKITYPGAGVAFVGSSPANVSWLLEGLRVRTIGPDKINQLRHVRLLRDPDGVAAHMREHAAIIGPKFRAVARILAERLGPFAAGTWTDPEGGYFVSLDVAPGCARRAVELAGRAGIAITPAGATFPYGDDPDDANIRLAPTLPPLAEVEAAVDGLCTCILLAEAEQALGETGATA